MRFASLAWLFVAGGVLVALVLAYALDFTRRARLLEKIGRAPQLARMTASVSRGRRVGKAVLVVLGTSLVALALARPQVQGEVLWKERGIDVVVVMDFSKSMLARDVHPSRVERAKRAADDLLDQLAGDRAAVVAFGGGAVHYPLTSDYEAAKILYHGLDPRDMAPGSDLGEALLAARCLLVPGTGGENACRGVRGARLSGDEPAPGPATTERARAIVVLTDGEDTEGRVKAELERAHGQGIEVYFVGIGTPAGTRIPELDDEGNVTGWKLDEDGKSFRTTRLAEGELEELAKVGGGEDHYFRDDPRRFDMSAIAQALHDLEQGDPEERMLEIPDEAYQAVLFPAFMVLLVEACLADRRREKRAAQAKDKLRA